MTKWETASEYLEAHVQLMTVEDLRVWAPHLRSRTTLRTTSVRRLAHPTVADAALRAEPRGLMDDLEYFGFLFESIIVIRNLRVCAQAVEAEVFNYREKGDLEVDAIVEMGAGIVDHLSFAGSGPGRGSSPPRAISNELPDPDCQGARQRIPS